MDFGLTGRKALVLASSKGLGKAVATELAQEGVEVMICSRTESDLLTTKKEIEMLTGSLVHIAVGDVSTDTGRKSILDAATHQLGTVDILVTNSGGPPFGTFESHEIEAWESAYRLLLESTVGMIKGVLPEMKKQQWGRIITISSQAIKQPVEGLVLSNSVRASLLGLVKTLSNELGSFNITVNNVLPGYTETERLKHLMDQNPDLKSITEEIPVGRIALPDEFAAVVAFLASERASYITGISLPVDGGWIKGI